MVDKYTFGHYASTEAVDKEFINYDNHVREQYYFPLLNKIKDLENHITYLENKLSFYENLQGKFDDTTDNSNTN